MTTPSDNRTVARVGRKYSIWLLVAAVTIIAVGIAIRPAHKPDTAISELESARLRRLTQERRLRDLGEYISYVAQNAAASLVYVPELRRTAVNIGSDGNLATATADDVAPNVTGRLSDGRSSQLGPPIRRPDLPVLLLKPPADGRPRIPVRAQPETGDWVLAVALREDASPVFAYGLYESSVESRCGKHTYTKLRASIPLTGALLGGGLFSLTGELAGIVVRCEGELAVLSVSSLLAAQRSPLDPNDALEAQFGLRVSEDNREGVQVAAVWARHPAAMAGINPGDRVISAGVAPVETPSDLYSVLKAGSDETEIKVITGRRSRSVKLSRYAAKPSDVDRFGITLTDTAKGVAVSATAADSTSRNSGILPGDIVTRIGKTTPAIAADAARELMRVSRPTTMTLSRDGATYEVTL